MSESRAIVARKPAGEIALIATLEDAAKMAEYVARSGLFACKNSAEALVKIVAGREMGFGPIASMSSIHIIEGKPSPGADLIAAAIRRPGSGYDFTLDEINDEACAATFYRYVDGQKVKLGTIRYTMEACRAKGWHLTQGGKEKATWIQRPANMLYSRVITDGKRFHCPDVLTSAFDRDEIEVDTAEVYSGTAAAAATGYDNSRSLPPARNQPHEVRDTYHENSPGKTDAELGVTFHEDGTLTSDLDRLTTLRTEAEMLIRELNFKPDQIKRKLAQAYGGAESLFALNLEQMEKFVGELHAAKKTRASKGNNSVPASAATA